MPSKELAILISGNAAGAQSALKGVKSELQGVGTEAERAGGGFSSMAAAGAKIGLVSAGITMVAGAVAGLSTAFLGGNREMEQYQVQFGVLLKSADAAKARMAELQRVNLATPFRLDELVVGDKVLTGFGLHSAEAAAAFGKSGADIRRIAIDVAAGTGQSMESIALQIGKFSTGATGDAMMRFSELGAVTRGELSKMGVEFSKAGELTSPIDEAMVALLASLQDKFGGMGEAQSTTFNGMLSNIQDWAGNTMRVMSEPLFDAAKVGMQALLDKLGDPEFNASIARMSEGFRLFVEDNAVPQLQRLMIVMGAIPGVLSAVAQDLQPPAAAIGGTLGKIGEGLQFLIGFTGSSARLAERIIVDSVHAADNLIGGPVFNGATRPGSGYEHRDIEGNWDPGYAPAYEYGTSKSGGVIGNSAAAAALAGISDSLAAYNREAEVDALVRHAKSFLAGGSAPAATVSAGGGGPGYSLPPSSGGGGGAGSAATAAAKAEKKLEKAIEDADKAMRQFDYDAQVAGENSGQAWRDGWAKADSAIRDAYDSADKAMAALDNQDILERSTRARQAAFDESIAQSDQQRSRAISDHALAMSQQHELAALELTSFNQQMSTAQTAHGRSQQDEYSLWMLNRDLGKAKTDDERKAIQERYDDSKEVLSFQRSQEDEDRTWQLAQDKLALGEKHRLELEDLAATRSQEDADAAWKKSQDGLRAAFEKTLADEAMSRAKANIEAERDAKLTAINEAWNAEMAAISLKHAAVMKNLRDEQTQRLLDSGAPNINLPTDPFANVDPEHAPGGSIFDAWWQGADQKTRDDFKNEHPDWGLAEGGIVTRPTLAWIAERGTPEAVIPLNRLGDLGSGGTVINVYVQGSVTSERDLAESIRTTLLRGGKRNLTVGLA